MRTTATWTSRRRLVFWGGVGLVLLHAGAWAICNHTLSGDHTHLWYNHYNGRPTRLLATYALLSASILYASLSCLYGYAPSLRADRPRGERLTAMGISGIAVGGVVYSPLIVGQAIASATGHGASAVTAWTEPIMASTALIALVTVLGLLFGPRVAAAIAARTQVDLPEQRRVLDQIRQESEAQARRHAHLANLAIAIDERLMHVRQDYAAAVAVETATRICVEHGIPVERRKVAREAVRILTLSYDNVVEAPFYDDDEIGERAGLAPYYLMHADGSYFFDDVYKVCYLAVGAHGLSSDIDESEDIDIEPWHRELGTIVAHALATYKKRSA